MTNTPTLIAFATLTVQMQIWIPLALGCLILAAAIPYAASRGKLHMPGYVGIAALAAATGFLTGHLSGARRIQGTTAGVVLSIIFFLMVAAVIGSILALFFYRGAPEN